MNAEMKNLHKNVHLSITQLAAMIAPKVTGWIRYYGYIRESELSILFEKLNERIAKWVRNKYKIRSWWKCFAWVKRVAKHYPTMFAHWKYGWVP